MATAKKSSSKTGFQWSYDKIRPSLKTGKQKAQSYLSRTTTYHSVQAEGYMKQYARWTDRSGNARQGLTALADNSGSGQGKYQITIFHKMPYGIWLEIRNAGKYAIIVPTLQNQAPMYFETARQLLDKMFGSGV